MTIASDIRGMLSRRGWLAGAFVLGLVLGLILAWRVWPARWVDTDPSDLRAAHQREYVIMIADSWTVTGDANEARERLYELVEAEDDWLAVDALIASTIDELDQQGNAAAATRLSRMRGSVPLPSDPVAPAETEPEPAARAGSPRWVLVLIGLAVVVFVIAVVIWLVMNEMRKREGTYDSDDEEVPAGAPESSRAGRALALDPIPGPGGLGIHAVERDDPTSPQWDEATFMEDGLADDDVDMDIVVDQDDMATDEWEGEVEQPLTSRPSLEPEDAWHVETEAAESQEAEAQAAESDDSPDAKVMDLPELDDDDLELLADDADDDFAEQVTAPAIPQRVEPEVTRDEAPPLAVFETAYEFGDDDFYHAFTIESANHEFLGQCGIVISDVVGIDGSQLVDAFDIWLFETRGTRTISKVLASEHAFTSEDLGAKLARKGELVLAQEGLIVTLETESLRLSATVVDFAYRDDELESDAVFSRLSMHMVVEQIGD